MVGATVADHRGLFRGSRRSDNSATFECDHLHQHLTDTTRGRMDQRRSPRRDWVSGSYKVVRGHALEYGGSGDIEVQPVRYEDQRVDGTVDQGAGSPQALAPGHAVSHCYLGRYARLEAGDDPASLLAESGPVDLLLTLQKATVLSATVVDERIANLPTTAEQVAHVSAVIATQPACQWHQTITATADRIGVEPDALRAAVAEAGRSFNEDRRRFISDQLAKTSHVRARIEQAANASPADRWTPLARTLDSRLADQRDWPATAAMLQQVHEAGHDVPTLANQLITDTPLGEEPAQDLRYRLVGYLPDATAPAPSRTEKHDRPARSN